VSHRCYKIEARTSLLQAYGNIFEFSLGIDVTPVQLFHADFYIFHDRGFLTLFENFSDSTNVLVQSVTDSMN